MSLLRSAVVVVVTLTSITLLLHLPVVVDSAPLLTATTIKTTTTNLRTDTAAFVINKENEKLIEEKRNAYEEYGCLSSWDTFPSIKDYERQRGSSSMVAINRPTTTNTTRKMGMACMCGMLHDSASLIFEEFLFDDVSKSSASASASASASSISLSAAIAGKSKVVDATTAIQPSSTSTSDTKFSDIVRSFDSEVKCINGKAGNYPCKNVDLIAHIPFDAVRTTNFGTDSSPTEGSDVWGWTYIDVNNNDSKREFVIWGVREGTFFVEVTDFKEPKIVGYLPSTTGESSNWKDMKVINNFVYIGSEMDKHGIQIFDLTKLLGVECVDGFYCVEFDLIDDINVYRGTNKNPVSRSHNIVANEETGFVYIVGSANGCSGGLHIVDVSDPENPSFVGCYDEGGYVHDAQCVSYDGVDTNYVGNEICFCFNEYFVLIVDVTDKNDIKKLSRTYYSKRGYTHQGWLSSGMTHLIFGDEVDELNDGGRTRTLLLNIEDLKVPTNFQEYHGTTNAIDHNLYIANAVKQGYDGKFSGSDIIYQSNYRAGLRIQQVPDINNDYDNDPNNNIIEVGYFDTFPNSDSADFNGAWSVYPFFSSQLVAISSIEGGLFLVLPNLDDVLVSTATLPSPTEPPTDVATSSCEDRPDYLWRNKPRKDCDWVGRPRKGKKRRKRCKKRAIPGERKRVQFYCPATCAAVGTGPCRSQ